LSGRGSRNEHTTFIEHIAKRGLYQGETIAKGIYPRNRLHRLAEITSAQSLRSIDGMLNVLVQIADAFGQISQFIIGGVVTKRTDITLSQTSGRFGQFPN